MQKDMLIGLVFFGTGKFIPHLFHIGEICMKLRFHYDQCVFIRQSAAGKIFQSGTLQVYPIWRIHENTVKGSLSLKRTERLKNIHVHDLPVRSKFRKCKIITDAGAGLRILFDKNSLPRPAAQSLDAYSPASAEQIQKTAVQKLGLKDIK